MGNIPSIPKEIIQGKDKRVLATFMLETFDRRLDGRLGWEEALAQSKEAIRIKRRLVNKGAPVNAKAPEIRNLKYKAFLENKAEEALANRPNTHHLFEQDTAKWLWDTDKVEWLEPGFAPGTCKIRLKCNDRILPVDRETAGIWLDVG